MANTTKVTPQRRERFLALLADGHTVGRAATACGITPRTAYRHRDADPMFRAAWASAYELGTQALEEEARRRAVDGITREKPIFHRGVQVGSYTEIGYSDTLLMFLLKARRPDTYRERTSNELTGPGGGPIQTESAVTIYLPDNGRGDVGRDEAAAVALLSGGRPATTL